MNASRKLLQGGVIGIGGRVLLVIVQLLSHLILARSLGSSGYGVLSLAIPIAVLATFLARAGIPRTLQKFVPSYRANGDAASVFGLFSWSFRRLVILSIVVTVFLLATSSALAERVFGHDGLTETLVAVGFSIVFANIVCWLGALGLSLGRVRLEVLGQYVAQPIAFLILLVVAIGYLGDGFGPLSAGIAFSGSWIITASLIWQQSGTVREEVASDNRKDDDIENWARYSWRVFFPDLIGRARDWIDLVVAGVLLASGPLGVLALCLRIAYLPSMILASFSSIFSHKVSELFAANNLSRLDKEYSDVTFSSLSLNLPTIMMLFALSKWILTLFGADFAAGAQTISVILIGQLTVALAGPSWYIMILTGLERELFAYSLISIAISICLCILLIPKMGILGAGIANATSLAFLSCMQVLRIFQRHRILPFKLWQLRIVPPLLIAYLAVIIRSALLPVAGEANGAILSMVVFVVTYILAGLPFGVWKVGLLGDVLAARANERD